MKKLFKLTEEQKKILGEMIDDDGQIISGKYPIRGDETSINFPNDEGYAPETTDTHGKHVGQPPSMLRYGGFWVAMGVTESKNEEGQIISEDIISKRPKKTVGELIDKKLTKDEIITSFPLTKSLFDEMGALVERINKITTKDYGDNIDQIKSTFISEFLDRINYEYLPDNIKNLILNGKQ